MKIYQFQNFVSKSDCYQITKWFEIQTKNTRNGESLFDNRTIPYSEVANPTIKRLMNKFRFDATIQSIVQFKERVYPEYTDLVYWPEGVSMDVHSDAWYPDGTPGKFYWRKYGAVLYLNDNYEGGHTYFPDHGIEVEPEVGKLLLFPSDLEHQHGVTEVTRGHRFTMPIWFTSDITKLEF